MKRLAAFILLAGFIQATSWGDELWMRPRSLFSSRKHTPFQEPVVTLPEETAKASNTTFLPPRSVFSTMTTSTPTQATTQAVAIGHPKPAVGISSVAAQTTSTGIARYAPPKALFGSNTVKQVSFDQAAGMVTTPPTALPNGPSFLPPRPLISSNLTRADFMPPKSLFGSDTIGEAGPVQSTAIGTAGMMTGSASPGFNGLKEIANPSFMPPTTLIAAIEAEDADIGVQLPSREPSSTGLSMTPYRPTGLTHAMPPQVIPSAYMMPPKPLFSSRGASLPMVMSPGRTHHPEIDTDRMQQITYRNTAPTYTATQVLPSSHSYLGSVSPTNTSTAAVGQSLPLPTGYKGSTQLIGASGQAGGTMYDAFDPMSAGPFCGLAIGRTNCGSGSSDRPVVARLMGWLCYRPTAGDALPKLRPHPYVGPVLAFRCNGTGMCGPMGCGAGGSACTSQVGGLGDRILTAAPPRSLFGAANCRTGCVPPGDDAFPGYRFANAPYPTVGTWNSQPIPQYSGYSTQTNVPPRVVQTGGEVLTRPLTRP